MKDLADMGYPNIALAGCEDKTCQRNCVRKDARIKYRWKLRVGGECGYFLPRRKVPGKEVHHGIA